MPPSHNGIAPVLSECFTFSLIRPRRKEIYVAKPKRLLMRGQMRVSKSKQTGPYGPPGSIPGGGVSFLCYFEVKINP